MTMEQPEHRGKAWSVDEERRLYDAFTSGKSVDDCMALHGRAGGGVRSRLRLLGLMDEIGQRIKPVPDFAASAASQKRAEKITEKKQRALSRKPEAKIEPVQDERFREALHAMEETDRHLFITGKAGVGKSTLLNYFCRTTEKQPVVLAPTGVAALNVKGQTIHRFFNFYVDVTPEKVRGKQGKPRNAKLYKKLKTIVIDEVSMVRADLLDCIDVFLRMHGPNPSRAFGGVQMIFIGDLYQLPPVVGSQEKELFATHYPTPYFFSAHALRQAQLQIIELDKVYRQKDTAFIGLLNRIRVNAATADDLALLNTRVKADNGDEAADTIALTSTNAAADAINEKHLAALDSKMRSSGARVEGDFGKEYFPAATELRYKVGAQVMLLNNDSEKRWVNGSIGTIEDIRKDDEGEYLSVALDDGSTVEVRPHTWEVYRFGVEDDEVVSEPVGAFTQYPIRLAWAITIHKSQGKTFRRVVIDIGRGAFAAGQTYVALSRCTSFEGVTLRTPVRAQDIRTDRNILSFLADPLAVPEKTMTLAEKIAFIQTAIDAQEALAITYIKADDTETERKVLPLKVGSASYQGNAYDGMKAFCTVLGQEMMFRVDRILKMQRVAKG